MRDEFTAAIGQAQFATTEKPLDRVDVFRNGLLQRVRSGEADYRESASPDGRVAITFSLIEAGHFVTLLYRV